MSYDSLRSQQTYIKWSLLTCFNTGFKVDGSELVAFSPRICIQIKAIATLNIIFSFIWLLMSLWENFG